MQRCPLPGYPVAALPLESLALTKAHRSVEGNHRQAAWRIVLDYVPAESRERVITAMDETRVAWQRYRDGVAVACGLEKNG